MSDNAAYVLGVVGSARKEGNSDLLCGQVLAGAREGGAEIEKVYLADLDIGGCLGCGACQRENSGRCVRKDDMAPLYPKLERCTVLVIASPIYFLSLSGQTTVFLNRTYPFFSPEGPTLGAKRLIACLAYGDRDPIGSGCDIAARILRDLCVFNGLPMDLVHASALTKGAVAQNKAVMDRAFDLGRAAVGGSEA